MRFIRQLSLLLGALLLLSGCEPAKPVKLGFLGGLSGRVTDLGSNARNGMLLAVEQVNARGGLFGKPVQTIIRDDKQDPAVARIAMQELVDAGVDVVIGPVTSVIATSVVDIANQSSTLMIGVSTTTNELSNLDDQFIRVLSPTAIYANKFAGYLYNTRGIRSYSVIYDTLNRSYSESWVADFEARFSSLGGRQIHSVPFASGEKNALVDGAEKLLESPADIIILVTNSVDAALLAKLIREAQPHMLLATAEWASTERLIELGGRYVEGVIAQQYLDRDSSDPAFVAFRQSFLARFNQEPGFAGMLAYNATTIALGGLQEKPSSETLRDYILRLREFATIQGPTRINEFGDGIASVYVTEIANSRFKVITQL